MKNSIRLFIVFAVTAVSFSCSACAKQVVPAKPTASTKKTVPAKEIDKTPDPNTIPKTTQPLFIIDRSKNTNVVHYDARLTADGGIDPNEPVVAYWIMLAKDGKREDLNWLEKKKAYGFQVKPDPSVNGSYKMTVAAVPQGQITVRKEGKTVRAELVIDGQPAVMEKIYINSTDGLLGPKVHSIELYGKDIKTGEKRYQKVTKK
jgi:hypothetical protein